eukprot:GHRQ01025112.1.p1 GENE.GHRQ01025112.1~~GHRQ01025112.1.p1  ORF type:complete len:167 (+),score=28.38 GHRQ01025112.1:142-642(+)
MVRSLRAICRHGTVLQLHARSSSCSNKYEQEHTLKDSVVCSYAQADQNSWMFCPYSGYMLEFDAVRGVAHCPQTGYTKQLEDLEHIKLMSRTNMEDYRRQYQLEPLVKEDLLQKQGTRVRATVDEICPACGNRGLEFYTMQLRSADEGQTVFYECTKCGHKYSTNN